MAESDTVDTSTIGVHRGAWANLSPEFAAMLAPPVSVSCAPVDTTAEIDRAPADPWRLAQQARSRGNLSVVHHRRVTPAN
jgi:hypothetical protein